MKQFETDAVAGNGNHNSVRWGRKNGRGLQDKGRPRAAGRIAGFDLGQEQSGVNTPDAEDVRVCELQACGRGSQSQVVAAGLCWTQILKGGDPVDGAACHDSWTPRAPDEAYVTRTLPECQRHISLRRSHATTILINDLDPDRGHARTRRPTQKVHRLIKEAQAVGNNITDVEQGARDRGDPRSCAGNKPIALGGTLNHEPRESRKTINGSDGIRKFDRSTTVGRQKLKGHEIRDRSARAICIEKLDLDIRTNGNTRGRACGLNCKSQRLSLYGDHIKRRRRGRSKPRRTRNQLHPRGNSPHDQVSKCRESFLNRSSQASAQGDRRVARADGHGRGSGGPDTVSIDGFHPKHRQAGPVAGGCGNVHKPKANSRSPDRKGLCVKRRRRDREAIGSRLEGQRNLIKTRDRIINPGKSRSESIVSPDAIQRHIIEDRLELTGLVLHEGAYDCPSDSRLGASDLSERHIGLGSLRRAWTRDGAAQGIRQDKGHTRERLPGLPGDTGLTLLEILQPSCGGVRGCCRIRGGHARYGEDNTAVSDSGVGDDG